MIRKPIILLCACLAVGYVATHAHKRVSHPVTTPTEPARQLAAVPVVIDAPPVIAANAPLVVPNISVATVIETADSTLVPVINEDRLAQETKGNDEKEKFRLLHELRARAARDAEGALAQTMKLPEGSERNQALGEVCFGIAETHPADAVELAKTLHLDEQPGAVMEYLVQQWASADLTPAVEWVNAQPAGEPRDGLTTRTAYIMAQTAPVNAVNLVLNQIPSGQAQDNALLMIVHQWAGQDAAAAANWVQEFPTSSLRERAMQELQLVVANH